MTRAQLLAFGGVAGLGLVGGRAGLFPIEEAHAQDHARDPVVRRFVSRPDLRPPQVTILARQPGTAAGLLFLAPSSGPGQRGALILDDNGEVVWFRRSNPNVTMDFRAGLYKGKPVLSWWEGKHVRGVGLRGSYVLVDSSYRELARFESRDRLRPDFHEYLLTPEGTALVTSYDAVTADLSAVGGPKSADVYEGVVRELHIPTGRVLFEWRSLAHVAIAETFQTEFGGPFDYFHVNSVGFDSDGHLLVSSRNTWTIYKIHRRTGDVIWRLGGKRSDFAMGPGARFAFQHDARSHERGRLISLFDNGPHPRTRPTSRALVLRLDVARRRATVARQLVHSKRLFARVTGNQQFLPNGNTLVCWGSTGYFTEYDADGRPLLDARLPDGGQNYRVFRFPWVGRPYERPRLARRGGYVFASWNGATEVSLWRLLTGLRADRLDLVDLVVREGFETAISLPRGARFAAVAAVDEEGRVLGTSRPLRV